MYKKGERVEYPMEPGFIEVGTIKADQRDYADTVAVEWDNPRFKPAWAFVNNIRPCRPVPVVATPVLNDGARIHTTLPNDSASRKQYALSSGLFDYFPAALAAVAKHSFLSNEKHNPGEPVHWSRGKSADHLDAALRHIMERDLEGAAWRILAALQMQLEAEGAPVPPGARDGTE